MFIRVLLGKHESRAGELAEQAEQVDSSNYMGPGHLLPR